MARLIRKCWMLAVAALAAAAMLPACDLIYDDGGECPSTEFLVSFCYDMNMEYADAFASQVESVSLYAFGSDGLLAYSKSQKTTALSGQAMDVSDIAPGTYTLLVWAGGEQATADSWTTPDATVGVTTLEELSRRINRSGSEVDFDLTPLFHGMTESVTFAELEDGGTVEAEVALTKDTNDLVIVLQNLSGEALSSDSLRFELNERNEWLAYDNSIHESSESIVYSPWAAYSGQAGEYTEDGDDALTSVSAAVAEFSLSRLVEESDARLKVYNANNNKLILSIPVVDYLLLVKGYHNASLSDQEYLDRQSSWSMVFFLDDTGSWVSSTVVINSWRLILSTVDM